MLYLTESNNYRAGQQMALQPAAVYHKMQDVLRRYELGKLKGQKKD